MSDDDDSDRPIVSTPVFRVILELDLEAEGIDRIWRQVELPIPPVIGMQLTGLGDHAVFDVEVEQVFVSVECQEVTLGVKSLAPGFEPVLNEHFIKSHGWSC